MKRVQACDLIVLLHAATLLLLPNHLVDAQTNQTSKATTDANEGALLSFFLSLSLYSSLQL